MCRLLGYVSASASTLGQVLGDEQEAFLRLAAERHGDGWGIGFGRGDGIDIRKEAASAATSPAFAELAGTLRSDAALVHLRWATLGLGVSLANTHPFGDGRLAFAHNGSITEMPSLETLTGERSGPAPLGDTDSERYWLTARSAIEREGEDLRGLAAAVLAIEQSCRYTSLNCMLLTPDRLIAVCWFGSERIAPDLGDGYYDLSYRSGREATVVASSGWHGPGWKRVPNGATLVVERAGGATRVVGLRDLVAA